MRDNSGHSRQYLTKQAVITFGGDLPDVAENRKSSSQDPGASQGTRDQQVRVDKEVVRVDSSQEKITTLFSQQGASATDNEEQDCLLTSVRNP